MNFNTLISLRSATVFVAMMLFWGRTIAEASRVEALMKLRDGKVQHEADDARKPVVSLKVFVINDEMLELLPQVYPELRELSSTLNDATPAGLGKLNKLPKLDSLHLYVPKGKGDLVTAICELSRLRALEVEGDGVGDEELKDISRLAGLKRLGLSQTLVTDAGLATLRIMSGLEELDLQFVGTVGDAGMAHLKAFGNLRVLNLQGTNVSDQGMTDLGAVTSLQELSLPPVISNTGMGRLAKLTGLRKFDIGGTPMLLVLSADGGGLAAGKQSGVPEIGARGVAVIGKFRELRELNLKGALLTDEAMATIGGLSKLQVLVLAQTPIGDNGLSQIRGLSELTQLDLTDTKIADKGLPIVAGFTKLRSLKLHGTRVTDAAMQHVAGLRDLEALDLFYTNISNAGLAKLTGLVKLRVLDLGYAQLTPAGIAMLRSFPQLEDLDLVNVAGVNDQTLAGLLVLKHLKRLSLRDADISDAGLMKLAEFPALEYLELDGPKLTKAGVEKLRRARPSVSIGFSQ